MAEVYKDAEVWEDGLRTDPNKKSFEWWYFDANFENGATLVLTFYTKSPSNAAGKPDPQIQIVYTDPQGKKHTFLKNFPVSQFSAEKQKCDLKFGNNTVSGNLKKYQIHLELPEISGDIEFDRVAPSYSTATKDTSKPEYFGWFPAIPYGNVSGNINYQGREINLKGNGYHDHNWGIIDIKDVCDYWYWGRGNAGGYYMIFTVMILPKILGGKHASILYLANKDKILIGESNHLDLTKSNINPPKPEKGHLPTALTFTYQNEGDEVDFTLTDPKLIEKTDPLNGGPWWKHFLNHLFAKPLYVRYNANLELNINLEGKKESKNGNGLYEIMILH